MTDIRDIIQPLDEELELVSPFSPSGDQPRAIAKLKKNIRAGVKRQTLLGVTGSGKTFTIANLIKSEQRPTLVMAPNKTCLLYTSPSPRDKRQSRMPSSA